MQVSYFLRRCVAAVLGIYLATTTAVVFGNQFVRLDYNLTLDDRSRSTVFIEVFDIDRPITATNFMQYVNGGLYDGTLMHRLVSGFVLQGGGFYERRLPEPPPQNVSLDPTFRVDLDGNPNTSNPTVNNEFDNQPLRSNLRGTLAMAKVSGDPNSATNQFFFNLIDNDETSPFNNLDADNGGFTVFAQVIGDGMTLIDAFASLGVIDLNPDTNDDGFPDGGVFGQTPFFGSTLVRLERAARVDYLGTGSVTNVPGGGIAFTQRDAFIDTGASFTGSGPIIVGAGRTLGVRENVSLNRQLVNHGTLAPGLQLGFVSPSSFVQSSTGVLEIQLRGVDQDDDEEDPIDDEHDSLYVIGQAQIDGKLDISLINQYVPSHGHSFTVLSAASISGEFASIDLPLLSAGFVWGVNQTATSIRLGVSKTDFNLDGVTNLADYVVWRNMAGQTGEELVADANGDMVVDSIDLAFLHHSFGGTRGTEPAGAGAVTAVPEPSTAVLVGMVFVAAFWRNFTRSAP